MNQYIEKFQKGTSFLNIVSAVTQNEMTVANEINIDYIKLDCIKFIPSSGAATRMFKDLFAYLDNSEENETVKVFFSNLEQFPFYADLLGCRDSEIIDKETIVGRKEIIDILLNSGLNYGSLPKALLKFHKYDDIITTPIDEHIYEGENYINSEEINLHFTISKEHENLFNSYINKAIKGKDNIRASYSFQKKETDTLAVDMNNEPFRLEDGKILFRAGGHGSLIENLNDLDADIVFIKNIDNVCHQNRVKATIESKKKLASVGYGVKEKIDSYIKAILIDDYDLDEIKSFLNETLHIKFKNEITKDLALKFLNRPLRVCGMVKNEGEPGGGPFIVDNGDYLDLQICETVEINQNDEKSVKILNTSQYFNPVDLVCFIKDYRGEKYNLLDYVNEERYFISEKSYKGRKLKALEHPGLWNGAMHHWNTLFVEVPLITFNPVKKITDLLRDGHIG